MNSEQRHIRIEVPGKLHMMFMDKVIEEYGTYHAQWKALHILIEKYVNSPKKIIKRPVEQSKGFRVISNTLPADLKDKLKNRIYKEYGTERAFSKGVIDLIKMYVNNEI